MFSFATIQYVQTGKSVTYKSDFKKMMDFNVRGRCAYWNLG